MVTQTKKNITAKIILILLIIKNDSHAQPKKSAVQTLPVVLVTAKPITFSQSSTLAQNYMGKRQLEKEQYFMLSDAIKTLPGLNLTQAGGEGQQSSLFVRGTNSNHTQVRRDGMKLLGMSFYDDAFNFGLLNSTDLEGFRLLRGPVTSLYGADVLGGLLLLDTPQGREEMYQKISVEGGSRDSLKVNGELAGQINRTSLYLNVNRTVTGGYHQTPKSFQKPNGRYPRLPFHQTTGTLRLDQQLSEYTLLSLVNRLDSSTSKVQSLYLKKAHWSTLKDQFHRLFLTHDKNKFQCLVGVGYNHSEGDYDKKSFGEFQMKQSRIQGDGQFSWNMTENQKITLSGDITQDYLEKKEKLSPKFSTHGHQIGSGFHHIWYLMEKKLLLETSGRLDYVSNNKTFPTYRLSATYEILPPNLGQTWVRLSQGTAIKTPSLYQRHGQSPFFKGNPNVRSEQLRSYELNLKRLWIPTLQTEVTYFHNQIKNLIVSKKTGAFWSCVNADRALTQGIEASASYHITPAIRAEGNYTYTLSKDLSHHQFLLRRPFHKWMGKLSYEQNDFYYSVDFLYVGKSRDIRPLTNKRQWRKGYGQLNTKVHKYYTPNIKFYGRVENILNNQSQDPLGYKRPGIGVFLGVEGSI